MVASVNYTLSFFHSKFFALVPFYRAHATPLTIFKDISNVDRQPDTSKTDLNSWRTLGARAERNKENNAIPTKWTTYKVYHSPSSHSSLQTLLFLPCIILIASK